MTTLRGAAGVKATAAAAAAAARSAAAAALTVDRPTAVSANAGLKALGGLGALQWSPEEDEALVAAIGELGTGDWTRIAGRVSGRTAQQCMSRAVKALKVGEGVGPWSPAEDDVVRASVAACPGGAADVRWASVALMLPGRLGKQCRERCVRERRKGGRWSGGQRSGVPRLTHDGREGG